MLKCKRCDMPAGTLVSGVCGRCYERSLPLLKRLRYKLRLWYWRNQLRKW
jgi:hypothetical protein